MKNRDDKVQRILELARNSGIVSTKEVRSQGIHHEYIRQLCAEGKLFRVGRGLYMLPDAEVTIHHGLAQAGKAVPKGVICLLSALRFYEIGTQAPYEVWMAIDRRAAHPQARNPRMRIVRFSGEALTEGIDEHIIEGVRVRIFNPAKTVADCFKYRNKIGLDVALEALREVIRGRKCTTDEMWRYAKVCRVTKIMRPYMEAIV
ncbi:MAG: AbiEi antitoxin N-terminal domain-containing protein [Actinobacteria bacterium]|nr:AbiEi antitoxin N-terminal domain-containing protein [Actinomycetota bacterium]MCG2818308.1 type IV toxin-antitoxin system AbiEi family antitoxin domain-containing protein [Actinomycetes bacterium]MBU4218690.1 AbiEi antitoxin N-terminal domain-containing protein [Actinomycetota bacterium]MBU4359068.1 AbiEi antitoxin N-terminal domain-containing protein [Actinomycetota bacterium]MBU4393209.1 AbiEi antitoxin N-terminal domain-containing protein [Actinomycetota bacterium]